jgi:transposase
MRPKMNKWKAQNEKFRLKNELSKLHVYDPTVMKRDWKNNEKILEANAEKLASSKGFLEVEKEIAINPDAFKN